MTDDIETSTRRNVLLFDAEGRPLSVDNDLVIPAGTQRILIAGKDESGIVRTMEFMLDPIDGIQRAQFGGKVSISNPTAPPATTPVSFEGTPLNFNGTNDTVFTITDGTALTIQSIFAGAEGDPTEKASKVEILYSPDGGSTEKIIDRLYLSGATVSIFPDTAEARDGTSLAGIAVSQGQIIIRREHFGGSSKELDVIVRGFEQ